MKLHIIFSGMLKSLLKPLFKISTR